MGRYSQVIICLKILVDFQGQLQYTWDMKIQDLPNHPDNNLVPCRAWIGYPDESTWLVQFTTGRLATFYPRRSGKPATYGRVYKYLLPQEYNITQTQPVLESYDVQFNSCRCSMETLNLKGYPDEVYHV